MGETFSLTKKCDHVAFIMDGNGRWALARGLPRYLGHKEACNRIIELFEVCREYHIRVMSFFAFSTENWNRPQDEIDHLMDYLEDFFHKEIDYLDSVGARIVVSGDLTRLRPQTREICEAAIHRTQGNRDWILNVCLNYGGRDELVRAAKKVALDYQAGKRDLATLDETSFKSYFWVPDLPDVDLMIRTSGEQRLSNYLLYQNAYAELVFTPVKWPDFKRREFIECLKEFQGRERRFGGLSRD